jgi:hypothetical protein
MLERIKRWFGHTAGSVEEAVEGGSPVSTPAPGTDTFDDDGERETSTNAQAEGAAGQPWPGNN